MPLLVDDDIPDPDDVHKMMDAGYKLAFFPKPKYCVYVSFPFKTALSIYIAIFRVYPKLKDYIFSKGLCAYPAIEMYSNEIEASFIAVLWQDVFDFFKPLASEYNK